MRVSSVSDVSAEMRHPNAELLSPLLHADACSGLSGLYSIINGIGVVLADRYVLTHADAHALLTAGFRFMDGRLSPNQVALSGLRVTLWRALTDAVCASANRRIGVRLSSERFHWVGEANRDAAFRALQMELERRRVPLMLCRGGRYTVVRGITRSSLLLFDSSGAHWIAKQTCGVPGDCDRARHIIYPNSFMSLTV